MAAGHLTLCCRILGNKVDNPISTAVYVPAVSRSCSDVSVSYSSPVTSHQLDFRLVGQTHTWKRYGGGKDGYPLSRLCNRVDQPIQLPAKHFMSTGPIEILFNHGQ